MELTEEGEKLVKKKKKIIAGIRRKLSRDHTFHYLSRHVGKGVKDNIKRLQVKHSNGDIETVIERKEIEDKIKDYNTKHFKKAHNSIAYKDKICHKLNRNHVRDKMLNGNLQREDCDNEKVFRFMKLLQQHSRQTQQQHKKRLREHDWIQVVKKSKRNSASSVFSNRTYAVYKCALGSERMTNVLVRFHNMMIENEHCLQRWLNTLDAMMSKSEGMFL